MRLLMASVKAMMVLSFLESQAITCCVLVSSLSAIASVRYGLLIHIHFFENPFAISLHSAWLSGSFITSSMYTVMMASATSGTNLLHAILQPY